MSKLETAEPKKFFIFKNWKLLCLHSLLIWSLVFIQIFYGDHIGDLFNFLFPDSGWIENYRLFIFLLICGVIGLTAGAKFLVTLFLFVLSYPLILFLWSIPKILLWKIPKLLQNRNSGFGLYFFFNQVLNFFFKIRTHLISGSLFIISVGIIVNSTNSNMLYSAVVFLLLLLTWHFLNRTFIAINSEALVSSDIPRIGEDRLKIDVKNGKEIDHNNLQESVSASQQQNVMNYKLLTFINERAQTIKRDKNYVIILLYRVAVSYVISLVSLSLVNHTLFLANSLSFSTTETISLFDSFFYTFKSMYGSEVSFMLPSSTFARAINILAPMCCGYIFLFIVTVFFSIHSDKYSEKLDEAIETTQLMINNMEADFEGLHSITLDKAYSIIKRDKNSVVFLFLRYFIGKAEEEILEIT